VTRAIDTYRTSTIAGLSDSKFDNILKPSKPKKTVRNVTILGFDTEFTNDGRLLSVQLAGLVADRIVSNIFYTSELDKEKLFGYVKQFCQENSIALAENIVLVAHFASAEISHISNFLRDFSLRTYNRALEGSTEIEYFDASGREDQYIEGTAEVEKYKLRIVDLFGFYPMSLDTVGKMYGSEKISLEGIGGRGEKYWKEKMDQLLAEHPQHFETYAKRDAEVAILAYTRMRKFYQDNHGLDVLHYKTTPGLAMAIFRTQYLGEPVVPFDLHPEPYHHKNKKTGEWKVSYRNRAFLREEWREPRRAAMLAYWGGRNEANGRGLLKEPVQLYDVVSLYPSAATLQPLPNARTKWIEFSSIEGTAGLEGFANVIFEFPPDCMYPCLPVPGEMSDKLYFPLEGTTWCTLSEVREAIRLGVRVIKITGIGFKPGPDEINHPVRRYALDFMEKKRSSQGAERETNKLLLNSLIGKFVETQKDTDLGEVLGLIKRGTITQEQASQVYKEKKSSYRKRPRDVGGGWWIEAASLILGKARALMSQFISKGAIMAVTDSVLLPKGTDISCPALDELRSIGSDLRLEHEADTTWILRTRVYVLSKEGKAVKVARHGFSMPEDEFVAWVEECEKEGEAIPLTAKKIHLVGLKEAIEKDKALGQMEIRESHPKLDWDQKRKETQVVNPFAEWALYPPQPSVPERMRERGRPRKKN